MRSTDDRTPPSLTLQLRFANHEDWEKLRRKLRELADSLEVRHPAPLVVAKAPEKKRG